MIFLILWWYDFFDSSNLFLNWLQSAQFKILSYFSFNFSTKSLNSGCLKYFKNYSRFNRLKVEWRGSNMEFTINVKAIKILVSNPCINPSKLKLVFLCHASKVQVSAARSLVPNCIINGRRDAVGRCTVVLLVVVPWSCEVSVGKAASIIVICTPPSKSMWLFYEIKMNNYNLKKDKRLMMTTYCLLNTDTTTKFHGRLQSSQSQSIGQSFCSRSRQWP